MRIYLDTEFNGFGGELLSMALVADDGSEWYEVRDPKAPLDYWVCDHVAPKFEKEPIDDWHFRRSLHSFLRSYRNPEIVADWHADFVHFFDSFHGRDYKESLDWSCTTRLLSGPSDVKPDNPHNALSDARALRDWCRAKGF